jgi:hypothetical protein
MSSGRATELTALGVVEMVGGVGLTAGGVWLFTEGVKPCPAYHDCSTRGLGVVFGAPLLIVGIPLTVVGVKTFEKGTRPEPSVSFAPTLGADGAGAAVRGRF